MRRFLITRGPFRIGRRIFYYGGFVKLPGVRLITFGPSYLPPDNS